MNGKTNLIGVVPMGDVPDIVARSIAAHISGYLDLPATILTPLADPTYALDKNRFQYNVAAILKELEPMHFKGVVKVICVLSVDLFVPLFTHVYGEARQGGKVALVSLFRLKDPRDQGPKPSARVLERAAKVALHELCHLYNLHHCDDTQCLMHFSGILEELDQTPLYFCRYCARFFRDALIRHDRP